MAKPSLSEQRKKNPIAFWEDHTVGVWNLLLLVLLLAGLVLLLCGISIGPNRAVFFWHRQLARVPTGSMEPTMHVNAYYTIDDTPFEELQVGDIIIYYHPIQNKKIVHRIIEDTPKGFIVQGDANPVHDDIYVKDYMYRGRVRSIHNGWVGFNTMMHGVYDAEAPTRSEILSAFGTGVTVVLFIFILRLPNDLYKFFFIHYFLIKRRDLMQEYFTWLDGLTGAGDAVNALLDEYAESYARAGLFRKLRLRARLKRYYTHLHATVTKMERELKLRDDLQRAVRKGRDPETL